MTAIGVDIGGTHLRVALIAADGAIVKREQTSSLPDPETVIARIEDMIDRIGTDGVSAIGIGVPGRVDGRRVLSGGYVDLSKLPVADRIEQRFQRPVAIANDCSMALIAEAAVGAAKGSRNVVMLTIGTGIGGAVLDNGKLLRGRGTAGQLGHVAIDPNGRACVCGKRGCIETVSSGTSLGRHIDEAGLPAGTAAADLLARRGDGDAIASRVLNAWAAPLRLAMDSLAATLDPELFVLGGGLGEAAVAALVAVPAVASWYDYRVVAASLGDDAGVIGAGLAALQASTPAGKCVVLVNGVPASGKSDVARELARVTGWPVLSLDTIKNPFLEEIDGVDRLFNRRLGRASLKAMFASVADAPAGTTFIMDAWFGFQPRELVQELLVKAGVGAVVEVWCHAPPEVIGARYGARAGDRLPGHPGAEYVPELIALAARVEPLRIGPVIEADTTKPIDAASIERWLRDALDSTWKPG